MGRPPSNIDADQVRKLAKLGCNQDEIADHDCKCQPRFGACLGRCPDRLAGVVRLFQEGEGTRGNSWAIVLSMEFNAASAVAICSSASGRPSWRAIFPRTSKDWACSYLAF
jgi:hypothetical protein